MISLEINAKILQNKHFEFSQSKLAFISDIQKASGYINFMEKPGDVFQIKVIWKNKNSLDTFMRSEQFHFFKGAIITLSEKKTISITQKEQKN